MRYLFPALLLVGAILLCACASPSSIQASPPASDAAQALPEAAPSEPLKEESAAPPKAGAAQSPNAQALDSEEDTPAEALRAAPSQTQNEPGAFPALDSFTEAPALTLITADERTIEAFRTSYDWAAPLPDGTAASIIACGPAPLDMQDILEAQTVSTSALTLDFSGCVAQEVCVRCWPETAFAAPDTPAQELAVSIQNGVASFEPLPGGHVYEIFSRWETFGSGSYAVWLHGAEL